MSEEAATPEAPAAEPSPEVTAAAPAPTNTEEPKPEPDWRAAYVGLQTSQNKVYKRVEDLSAQNRVLTETIKSIKEGQTAILRQTVGEEEARAIQQRETQALERNAALQAAQAAEQYIKTTAGLFLETLREAGIDPNDQSIDWAKDASNVQEWAERVGPSVKAKLRQVNEERIKKAEESARSKTAKEVKEEAEALTQRQLKEAGVDKIDTAKGSAPSSFADRIREMDSNSPEFLKFVSDARAGRLKI